MELGNDILRNALKDSPLAGAWVGQVKESHKVLGDNIALLESGSCHTVSKSAAAAARLALHGMMGLRDHGLSSKGYGKGPPDATIAGLQGIWVHSLWIR